MRILFSESIAGVRHFIVRLRRIILVFVVLVLIASQAAAIEPSPAVSASTYLDLFDSSTLRGIDQPADETYDLFIDITGDTELDERIRAAAEERGYQRRPLATADLVPVEGWRLQAPAAEAWLALKAAAAAEGVSLVLTSAYRDLDVQASLFRGRLDGRTSDAGIDAALQFSAPPGYSKHHSGYAVDIGEAGDSGIGFVNTRAYAWLSAFDFAHAKAYGFIPSYPSGDARMGPDPEPWEFVWVGVGRIRCLSAEVDATGFCDVADQDRLDDIVWLSSLGVTVGCAPDAYCPDDAITRGEAASLVWRLHGAPEPSGEAPFVDVFRTDHFAGAVDWLWSNGIVQGTSADTFSPDAFLSPDETFALILRLIDTDLGSTPLDIPDGDFAAAPVIVGDVGPQVSRAEFATILRAYATGV